MLKSTTKMLLPDFKPRVSLSIQYITHPLPAVLCSFTTTQWTHTLI